MTKILGTALLFAIPFAGVAFRDPSDWVRVWALIGLGATMVAAMIAITNLQAKP